MVTVAPEVAALARRMGSLPWSALPATPPEVDARLTGWAGEVVDLAWHHLGRPDPFVVVAEGAASPDPATCGAAPALRLLRVGGAGTDRAAEVLGPLVAPAAHTRASPASGEGPDDIGVLDDDDRDDEPARQRGVGPLVAGIAELPAGLAVALVLAVGVAAALPADRFVRRDGQWFEVRLVAPADADVDAAADDLVEVLVACDPARAAHLPAGQDGVVRDPGPSARWLSTARSIADAGFVVVDLPGGTSLTLPAAPGSLPLAVTCFSMRGTR